MTVSVIIPAFNAQDTIGDAIRSVLEQTRQDFEIIVCDDKSSDATISVVEMMALQDPRIKCLYNEVNCGVSYARNVAMQAATGDWIAILDADDLYHPKRLEVLLELAERQNADVICDDLRIVSPCGKRFLAKALPVGEVAETTEISAATYISRSSRLKFVYNYLQPIIRKQFIDRHGLQYGEDLPVFEDFDFMARALIKGGKCIVTSQAFYLYRLTPDSASRTPRANWLDIAQSVDQALFREPEVQSNPDLVSVLQGRERFFANIRDYRILVNCVKNGNLRRAFRELSANLSSSPLFIRQFLRNMRRRFFKRPEHQMWI